MFGTLEVIAQCMVNGGARPTRVKRISAVGEDEQQGPART